MEVLIERVCDFQLWKKAENELTKAALKISQSGSRTTTATITLSDTLPKRIRKLIAAMRLILSHRKSLFAHTRWPLIFLV